MFDKMFRTIIVAGISFTICSSGSISSCELPRMARKTQRKYFRNGNNEDELDLQNDEEYDGFLDDVVVDSAWNIEDDSLVTLTGQTGDEFESFPFSLSFYFENREFQFQYEFESEWVEETSTAHVDKNGGLTADLTFERDSGEAHFDLTEYKNLSKLERLINNAKKDEPISACGLFGLSWRRISAIIAIYVVVAETAEQIRAKSNRKYNENLEQNGRGVDFGCYIFWQRETELVGYCAGRYHLGFADFSGVGCEVASVYNLRVFRESPELLSQTIYEFERWAIEFSIGWGHLGSNPRDIYRYLNSKRIKYDYKCSWLFGSSKGGSDQALQDFSEREEQYCGEIGIIVSFWNSSWTDGIHTFFVLDTDGKYQTYNNDLRRDKPKDYQSILEIASSYGNFIIGYLIYD